MPKLTRAALVAKMERERARMTGRETAKVRDMLDSHIADVRTRIRKRGGRAVSAYATDAEIAVMRAILGGMK